MPLASRAVALEISKLLTRFDMLNFFKKNFSLKDFLVRFSKLFLHFLVMICFVMSQVGSVRKSALLILEFFKTQFLVVFFSSYTSMISLLSVILLFMLVILLAALNVIWLLICSIRFSWLLCWTQTFLTPWIRVGSNFLVLLRKYSTCFIWSFK